MCYMKEEIRISKMAVGSYTVTLSNLETKLEEAKMGVALTMEHGLSRAKAQVEFIYPNLALGDNGLFKTVVDEKKVEKVISPNQIK